MAGPEEPTIWQDLPLSGDRIRILTIEAPTADSNSIRCSLSVVSLAEKPQYAALSYTWGNQPIDHVVHIGSKTTLVTKSCYEALKVFRDAWFQAQLVAPPWRDTSSLDVFRNQGVRNLWVDQLCIDQTNQKEKVDQIMLMARIYAPAAAVWSYIGHALSPTALKAKMSHIHKDLAHYPLLQHPPGDIVALAIHYSLEDRVRTYRKTPGPYKDIEKILKHPVVWINLLEMLERPYFRRRWVVQEVSLNGSVWTFWDGRFFELLSLSDCAEKVYGLHMGRGAINHYDSEEAYIALCDSYNNDFKGPAVMAGSAPFREGWNNAASSTVLFCLLFLCGSLEQSVPQDRFFSLRCLAPVDQFPFPDYTASVSSICLDYALSFLQTHLATLVIQCGGLPDPADAGTMPSWCPQWHSDEGRYYSLAECALVTGEARLEAFDSPPLPILLRDLPGSRCPAIQISAVLETHVSQILEHESSDDSDVSRREQVRKCHNFVVSQNIKKLSPTAKIKDLIEALKSPATMDENAMNAILHQIRILHPFQKITLALTLLQDTDLFSSPTIELKLLGLREVLVSCNIIHGKRFLLRLAVTQNCMLSVVDRKVQPGDIVALVPGTWLPLILRKKPGKEAYEIVGSAFLCDLNERSRLEVNEDGVCRPLELSHEDMTMLQALVIE